MPFYNNCSFSLQKIEVDKTIPLTKFVRNFKLEQITTLVKFYEERNLHLFEPCAITTLNNDFQILVPPVIEKRDNKLYIAEGHTRCLFCKQNNIKEIYALIVEGCKYPLASKPNTWDNVNIAYSEAKSHAIYEGRKFELARRIEAHTHWLEI